MLLYQILLRQTRKLTWASMCRETFTNINFRSIYKHLYDRVHNASVVTIIINFESISNKIYNKSTFRLYFSNRK